MEAINLQDIRDAAIRPPRHSLAGELCPFHDDSRGLQIPSARKPSAELRLVFTGAAAINVHFNYV